MKGGGAGRPLFLLRSLLRSIVPRNKDHTAGFDNNGQKFLVTVELLRRSRSIASMIRSIFLIAAVVLTLGISAPAHAKWRVAESDRFVVYSQSRGDDLKNFAEMLERFHVAMELETGRTVPIPSPSSRVTVYMVGTRSNLRELYGNRNSAVAGFYMPRSSGSVAFVPNIRISTGEPDFAQTVLLHEYAHHFLISTSRFAMPRWLSEGAAEYYASARFPGDGSIQIGLPANHRAYELANASDVSIYELLDPGLYEKRTSRRYDAFYGRSWLLFHYLAFSQSRRGQLQEYWAALRAGTASLEAAQSIFGDLEALDDELQSYNRKKRLPAMQYNANDIRIGAVNVRDLSPGMNAMMPVILRSKRGVDDQQAAEVLPKARAIAAKHPGDAGVLGALAEAEYDAGNDAEAIAAADRALAINANEKQAYVQKGYALFRRAEDAEDPDSAYEAALQPFFALNGIENDHPLPLIYYYRSFTKRRMSPPEDAQQALERATVLTPFDDSVSMDAAMMLAAQGKIKLAKFLLGPVASDPHGSDRAAYAQALVDAMQDAPAGTPFDVSSVPRPEPEDDGEGSGDDA